MPARWMRRALQSVTLLQLSPRLPRDAQLPHSFPSLVSIARRLHISKPSLQDTHIPLRKELKDAIKLARLVPGATPVQSPDILDDWELTVGIEVHAQLNTTRKLFSRKSNFILLDSSIDPI
jgi:hypothetical protein